VCMSFLILSSVLQVLDVKIPSKYTGTIGNFINDQGC